MTTKIDTPTRWANLQEMYPSELKNRYTATLHASKTARARLEKLYVEYKRAEENLNLQTSRLEQLQQAAALKGIELQ